MICFRLTKISVRATLLGAAACVATVTPAFAQDTTVPTDASSAAERDDNVIIVTAQKRAQDVQDVPISMAVVSGESLVDLGIKDFTELDRYVPNFYVQPTPGNNAFYIRGIGSTPGNLAFDQTVGLFVDGIYGGHARQFQAPFLDIERVEVLRGPQGALVGKNTSAGAVNVISAKPTRTFEASLEGSYEFELGSWRIFGMASGPVSDVVSARIALQYDDADGYVRNTALGGNEAKRKSFYGRGSILIDPGNGVDLLIKAEGGNLDLTGTAVENVATAAQLAAGIAAPGEPNLERATSGFPGYVDKDFDNTNTYNMTATANFEIGEHVLTSITGYSHYDYKKRLDSDFGAAPLFGSGFAEDFDQFSQEIRLASPTGKTIEYVLGIYAHINDYELDGVTFLRFGPYNGSTVRNFRQEDRSASAYVSATYHATDALRLIGSLRWTWEKKIADQRRSTTGVVLPSYLTTSLSGSLSETEWDPSVAIQYDITPDVMVYASYGQGSKAGGFVGAISTTTQAQFLIEPETSETWEAGIKLAALDRRLQLNMAAFRSTFSNLQVSSWDASVPPGQFQYGNAGKARSQGVEADGSFEVTRGITLNASVAYLDGKYLDFLGAVCPYNLAGCVPATFNAAGYPLTRSPKWSGTIGFNAEIPISDAINFITSGNMSFRSFNYLEESYNPVMGQDAYQKYDLRAGIRSSDRRWEIAIIGKNLTNEITASHAFGTPVTGGITKYIQEPRTIAAQIRLQF